jgi:hypothetical protein
MLQSILTRWLSWSLQLYLHMLFALP